MSETMRFTPDRLGVKLGDTARARVRNGDKVMQAFVIGTLQENARHVE